MTGAGRGIGRATAELFARHRAKVIICARSKRELTMVATAIRRGGGDVTARTADIQSPRQTDNLVRLAVRRYGRLDVLINNAGILGPRAPLVGYPLKEWERVIRVNLNGTFYLTRAAAQVMVRQRSGCIISVSSSVGRRGRADWGAYAVSKFGVEGLTQVLADELRSAGICAVTFNPGATRTRMRADAYPSEDPATLRDPLVPAGALLRLAACCNPSLSGLAFDLDNVPKCT